MSEAKPQRGGSWLLGGYAFSADRVSSRSRVFDYFTGFRVKRSLR